MATAHIVQLCILTLVLIVLAVVGYGAYVVFTEISNNTKKKLEKKNVSFTKDGMKVGVKGKTAEEQEDQAQRSGRAQRYMCQ
jgi:anionic cell wall polymer biosynthesis LytR-Cps2A-Psr (LCP) family protein